MPKLTRMTWEGIQKTYGQEAIDRAVAAAKAAPESDEANTDFGHIATAPKLRGFAAYKEHINRRGRPKSDDPRLAVSIRVPASAIAQLRATGRGWQTRAGDYLAKGARRGDLSAAA